MISKKLFEYLNKFEDKEQVFLFLTGLRHPDHKFGHIISASSLFQLIEDNVVEKDYIASTYSLRIPFYETDDGNIIPSIDYTSIYQNIRDHIDQYRSLFKGFRVGSMGNKQDCINKMVDFIINHNTTLEDVIEATMYYLERENPEYIMNADNFISNEKGSKLAIVLEEMPTNRLL